MRMMGLWPAAARGLSTASPSVTRRAGQALAHPPIFNFVARDHNQERYGNISIPAHTQNMHMEVTWVSDKQRHQ